MKQNSNEYSLFSGLVFWGSELLPENVILSLDNIREWAFEQKLIWDVEAQLIASERIEALSEHFVFEDKLAILIHLYKESGKLCYLEHPYLPINALTKKAKEVEIVYWQMIPTAWIADGSIKDYGEVRLGFWYPDISGEEFSSASTAKLVVKKFNDLFHRLSGIYGKKVLSNSVLDIEVDGGLKAKFFKTGRLFGVELTGQQVTN
jgi:hypothetical protein